MKIYLIGYRATGKSTVARLLAERLSSSWIDSDDEIERRAGCTIADIFQQRGEADFRDLETEVVHDLAGGPVEIIALGGGAVLRDENRASIAAGVVVWLQASPEIIDTRINGDALTSQRRPNLTSHGGLTEIESLLATRAPIYRACSNFTVETDGKSPQQVADEIVSRIM